MRTTRIKTGRFAALVQAFFCERLMAQRDASPRTVASYRDAFRLFLEYAERRLRRAPAQLELSDIDERLVLGFLEHLERDRGNGPQTRNARLAALRSFLRFASYREPASLASIQRVLAIPMKRFDRRLLGFLSRGEMAAVLAAPNRATWSGQRDNAMLTTLYNTGARVSELVNITIGDLGLERNPQVRLHGKGRKDRALPLWKSTVAVLREWVGEGQPPSAVAFPNRSGSRLSRAGVASRLSLAVTMARATCPSLAGRRVSPHTLRHTTAMHLLQSGVDLTVIALWLGHESPSTTHLYVEADLAMKERALSAINPSRPSRFRFKAKDDLLSFLDGLSHPALSSLTSPSRDIRDRPNSVSHLR